MPIQDVFLLICVAPDALSVPGKTQSRQRQMHAHIPADPRTTTETTTPATREGRLPWVWKNGGWEATCDIQQLSSTEMNSGMQDKTVSCAVFNGDELWHARQDRQLRCAVMSVCAFARRLPVVLLAPGSRHDQQRGKESKRKAGK
eukprot:983385-Rhodomonas_salina.3